MKKTTFKKSRRDFLVTSAGAGGGLALGFHMPSALSQKVGTVEKANVNIWVAVGADDTVVIKYARSEMGQGSMTSAPQLVAEELDADWKKVKIEYADTNQHVRMKRAWGDMATVGSRTIRNSQEYLRKAGASARAMLVAAASNEWGVPPGEITVSNGIVSHAGSKRRTTFGKLAVAAAKLEAPKDVVLKDPKDWKIAGKSMRRIDIPASVNGSQIYGADTQLPGMLYAAVAQCPVFGGKAKSFDESRVKGRRGITKVMTIDDGAAVVVVADNWWRAKEALKDVPVDWDFGANGNVSSASILQFFKEGLAAPDAAVLPNKKGDAAKAFAGATKVLEAEYFTPYLCHAPMETMGATVQIKDGRVDVWASTQSGEGTLASVAAALKTPTDNVYFHKVQAGGGFGRRGGSNDFGRQAALIAQQLPNGTPVKLLWTREEDTQHDFYRPLAMYKLKGGIDAQGNVVGWQTRIASGSLVNQLLNLPLKTGIDGPATEGFDHFPYEIPNQQHEYIQRRTHVPIGFWRTVGWSQTPFAREQFIDELAIAAGKDPYEFRRKLLENEKRPLGILDAVAKAAGWGKPLPKGVFRGIATTEPYGSYTSAVVELSVDDKGAIKLHRVVQAIDCGYVVNPDNINAQIQGSTVWAVTAAMWGEITLKDGRVEQGNFDAYRMMRMREMPKVEVVLAPTGGFWGGVGEPGLAPLIPAMCNAIFAATGKRIRSLPLKNQGFTLA